MAYFGEPGPAEWMQITNALRQKEMEVLALRERLAEAETRYTYAAPVQHMPFEVQMIHGRLADAEAQHAAYAASVHGMTFGVTAPVPPPVPNPSAAYVESGNDGYANEIDDTIAQACKVDEDTNNADDHGAAVYCKECQTWLNGSRQYEDHKTGKKHQKNMQRARRGNASSSVELQSTPDPVPQPDPVPDPVPEKKTDMWLWLEKGKEEKEAEEQAKGEDGKEEKQSRSSRRRRLKKQRGQAKAEDGEEDKEDGKEVKATSSQEPYPKAEGDA